MFPSNGWETFYIVCGRESFNSLLTKPSQNVEFLSSNLSWHYNLIEETKTCLPKKLEFGSGEKLKEIINVSQLNLATMLSIDETNDKW